MSIKEVFSHLHFLTKKAPVITEIYFSSLLFSLLSLLYLLFLSLFSLVYLLFISSFTFILLPPLPLLFIFLYLSSDSFSFFPLSVTFPCPLTFLYPLTFSCLQRVKYKIWGRSNKLSWLQPNYLLSTKFWTGFLMLILTHAFLDFSTFSYVPFSPKCYS